MPPKGHTDAATVVADLAEEAAAITRRLIDGGATDEDRARLKRVTDTVLLVRKDRPALVARVEKTAATLEALTADLGRIDDRIASVVGSKWKRARS